jgi:hypothetical protein
MKVTDTYKLGRIRHVIPLNENIECSELTFTTTSTDGCNFEAVVVKKSDLNSDASFEFNSSVNGMLSGTLTVDDVPMEDDEYMLLLRSETPCECIVEIQIDNEKIIRKKPKLKTSSASKQNGHTTDVEKYDPPPPSSTNKIFIGKFDIGTILVVLGVLILIYVIYRLCIRGQANKSDNKPISSTDILSLKNDNTAIAGDEMYRRLKEIQKTAYDSSNESSPV